MMDELDFLKKDWKKQDESFPRLSYDEIYNMLWNKSSSIVRWIFVISICELFFSTLLTIFLADEAYWAQMEKLGLKDFTIGLYIFSYAVTFYFIYLFYRNYRKISSTDNTATLMRNILKTRKTVKTYIAFVLIFSGFSGLVVSFYTIKNHQLTNQLGEVVKQGYALMDWIKFILIMFIAMSIVLGFIWLIYRLVYGILLKKLKRNYKDLKKLEM